MNITPHSSIPSRSGFTLVELLVVIGIIGVLAGTLLASFSGGSESARAARCLSNLKNLASACQTYGMASGHYPLAGNRVALEIDDSRGTRNVQKKYTEIPGWISTMTKGYYPGTSYQNATPVSLYTADEDAATYALTNGVLWQYVSGNRETYVCPGHVKKCGKSKTPRWSYLMSAYFGWDKDGRAGTKESGRKEYGQLKNADKILLFSEVSFSHYSASEPDGTGGNEETDAILQYSSGDANKSGEKGAANAGGGGEELGVNHIKGRNGYAHVAFADGHVEKMRVPMNGKKPDTSQMKELATWLATGVDVSYNGNKYKKLDQ